MMKSQSRYITVDPDKSSSDSIDELEIEKLLSSPSSKGKVAGVPS